VRDFLGNRFSGDNTFVVFLKRQGFTLIELIMVIVLIGIIAFFAAPRLGTIPSTNAGAFADKLRADVRYVQDVAMARNRRTRVYFNGTGSAPAAGYAAAQDNSALANCSAFTAVADPASYGNLTVTLNTGSFAGITITPTMTCLEYDALGRPYNCGGSLGSCSSAAAGMSIVVNGNGTAVSTIAVTSQTGAVN